MDSGRAKPQGDPDAGLLMSEDRGPYKQRADLLVETVHKIGKGAEKKIDGAIAVANQEAPSKT